MENDKFYEIRIQGDLDERWKPWFEDMDVIPEGNGITLLRGALPDQAAFYGLLEKLRNLNIIVIELRMVDRSKPGKPYTNP